MTNKLDKLTGLLKQPVWAIAKAELADILAELVAPGTSQDDTPTASDRKWSRRSMIGLEIGVRVQASAPAGKTAVIPILGPLDTASSGVDWIGGTTYESIQARIDGAMTHDRVTDVCLIVDSPGGSVTLLPETSDSLYALAQAKPVTAMVVGMSASAAYHLTSQARNIVVTPSGEVGSVGVLMAHADVSKMLEQMGVNITMISAGKYKTEFWPFAPLTDEAKAHAQGQINDIYAGFLSAVRRGRGGRATAAAIEGNFGEGRMLLAKDAKTAGMVDHIGTIKEVFDAMAADKKRADARDAARKRSTDTL